MYEIVIIVINVFILVLAHVGRDQTGLQRGYSTLELLNTSESRRPIFLCARKCAYCFIESNFNGENCVLSS